MSGLPPTVIGAATQQVELLYVWSQARPEAKVIIVLLFLSSIAVWWIMILKVVQMRRARKLNSLFGEEFTSQKTVLEMFDRQLEVEGCPLYAVYLAGCTQLDTRLRGPTGERAKQRISLKNMEHIKRAIENVVAKESLKLESGLILLAIAVSGAPFMGLLGTVWGVMSTFAGIAQSPQGATLAVMAPGVSAALVTTVAGLLVAIPSMFGYNWLVHNLRAFTVELDNFAQELVSKMESEFLGDDDDRPQPQPQLQSQPQPLPQPQLRRPLSRPQPQPEPEPEPEPQPEPLPESQPEQQPEPEPPQS